MGRKKEDMINISLNLPVEAYSRFQELADKADTSVTELLSTILRKLSYENHQISNFVEEYLAGLEEFSSPEKHALAVMNLIEMGGHFSAYVQQIFEKLGGISGFVLEDFIINDLRNYILYLVPLRGRNGLIDSMFIEIGKDYFNFVAQHYVFAKTKKKLRRIITQINTKIDKVKDSELYEDITEWLDFGDKEILYLEVDEEANQATLIFDLTVDSIDELPELGDIEELFSEIMR